MGVFTRESFKPRVRRAGAGMILVITLAFLVGAFIDDCGFFPGKGAAGGNPLDPKEEDPKPPSPTAGDDGGSGSGSPAAANEEGVVVELRDDRLHYRGAQIGWEELEAIATRTASADPPRAMTLTIASDSVTHGFVEKTRELLERTGVRVVEDAR